jgi:peptidoglycan L-alanyl-D-glutamate endopeptidase CwlK
MYKMDAVSEARLALVHPALAEKVRRMAETGEAEGLPIVRVTQGGRSWNEQAALYAQGRETLEQVNERRAAVHWPPIPAPENHRVTNAPPGHGWHNFFMAVDIAPDNPDLPGWQPDWNPDHPAWKRYVEIGESLGLRSGISWHDQPHFELTGKWGPSPPDEVRQLFRDGGTQAVWEAAFA